MNAMAKMKPVKKEGSFRLLAVEQRAFDIHDCWALGGSAPKSQSGKEHQDQYHGKVTNRHQPRLLRTADAVINDHEKTLRGMAKTGDEQAATRIHEEPGKVAGTNSGSFLKKKKAR
jgi:hypothetical protein